MDSFTPSRRKFFGLGAAGVGLLPALGRAEVPAPPPAVAPPENIQGRADDADRLTVKVMIGDAGPYRFIVDTGADRTVIATELAASLGLVAGDQVLVQGIARAVPAGTVTLKGLKLGRIAVDRLETPILPREWLDADGYLGIDAIDGRRVTFDFQNSALTIERSVIFPDNPRPDEALVRVNGKGGRLTDVDARVDGVRAFAFVDSGAEISIGNTRLFEELHKANNASFISNVRIPLYGVTGGSADGRLMVVDKIKIGALNFTNALLVICDLQVFDAWNLSDRPALFIGMNLLKKTSMFTIDYGRKELLFRLAQQVRIASRA